MSANDEMFLTHPASWPRWPALPVVKLNREPGGHLECGIVIDFKGDEFKVYKVGIYSLGDRPGNTWGEKLSGVETVQYNSAAELLKEWRID